MPILSSLSIPGRRASRPDTASTVSSTSSYYPTPSTITHTFSDGSSSGGSFHDRRSSFLSPVSPIIPYTTHNPWNDHPTHDIAPPDYTDGFTVAPEPAPTSRRPLAPLVPQIGNPPDYIEARIPVKPITYQFSALPNGAHLLLPPRDAPDSRPVYHIRTFQNTFSPSAHKTVIRRGGGDEGEFVGEFEFGMSSNKSYIFVHGKADHLAKVLHKTGKPSGHITHLVEGPWTWSRPSEPSVRLYWDCTNRSAWTCTLPGRTLAKYSPPDITPNRGMLMPTLQVTPTGQKYFDDILIATLIFEQKAALPMFKEVGEYRSYFSF
ncbi:hypothetical protein BDN72DRAFT_449042 [Pluteus cervinus]|uniref:Uncharacterized protein n=1 Tax=Pluteus cervinus TaxID=181527 RepID=A0ACD3BD61_9AGAR|nr:hypothetical protein BDN72DRAFT_449042 [Pluteus cervinus]